MVLISGGGVISGLDSCGTHPYEPFFQQRNTEGIAGRSCLAILSFFCLYRIQPKVGSTIPTVKIENKKQKSKQI